MLVLRDKKLIVFRSLELKIDDLWVSEMMLMFLFHY